MAKKMDVMMRRGLIIVVTLITLCGFLQSNVYASEVDGTGEHSAETAEIMEIEIITRHEDSTSMPLPDYYNRMMLDTQSENIALADVPRTGDISVIWLALSGLSGTGLLVLNRKRREAE